MAVWDKEDVIFELIDEPTGSPDVAVYTVKLQPIDQAYDAGAIACSQKTDVLSMWGPDADLDDETHYFIYVNAAKKDFLPARESKPMV